MANETFDDMLRKASASMKAAAANILEASKFLDEAAEAKEREQQAQTKQGMDVDELARNLARRLEKKYPGIYSDG